MRKCEITTSPYCAAMMSGVVATLLATPLSDIAGSVPIVAFFNVNVIGLLVFLLVAVVATALTVRHRPWDAALVAAAPTMILGSTINWDLIPIALMALAILAWARSKPGWAGVALGLAIAAKFFGYELQGPSILANSSERNLKSSANGH